MLPHDVLGDGPTTVVFAHGFTQTRNSWRATVIPLLARAPHLRCILVDLPGHGEAHDVVADVEETSQLLLRTGGQAHYIGYSLGARAVIQGLTRQPENVLSAVLLSGTAGIDDERERADRRAADERLASRIFQLGTEAFIREWLAQPLFSDLSPEQACLSDRLRNTPGGLASSLRLCGQGATLPMWNALPQCPTPILAMAGSRDTKYVELARRIASVAPNGRCCLIADAGHSAHLERPLAVAHELDYWIKSPSEYSVPTTS